MRVYKNIEELPRFTNAVLTIGTFDGVHLGHLQIIRQLIKEAEEVQGTPVLITFYPHPKQVIQSAMKPLFILNTPEEKYELLHHAGINNIVVVPFTPEFAEQPPVDYIRSFLVERFNPHTIIIGYDHRFGKDRAGDYQLLEDESVNFGYKVREIPEHILKNITISSTRIREALLGGDIETANQFLGYPYFFSGTVVTGKKLGRTIGYPTANLQVTEKQKLIPADAVYAVDVLIEDMPARLKGMMNIGVRPTVDGQERAIEVNIFDLDENLYGKTVKVFLRKRLRAEIRFEGLDALQKQLGKDKIDAIKALK